VVDTEVNMTPRKKIFICSPLRAVNSFGEIDPAGIVANIERVWEYCRNVSLAGFRPFAPHGFYTKFLKEENDNERILGIQFGIEELASCDELWWFGDVVSTGMSLEMQQAAEWGIPVCKGEERLSIVQENIHTYY
jgi:hypothetical protein